jgi:hypothetical protein
MHLAFILGLVLTGQCAGGSCSVPQARSYSFSYAPTTIVSQPRVVYNQQTTITLPMYVTSEYAQSAPQRRARFGGLFRSRSR